MSSLDVIIQSIYVIAAVLFIVGLKRMSSPTTARTGIVWAGIGMLMATIATFFYPGVENFALIAIAILLGTIIAGYTAKKVEMTEMPEMIALYNGMGGGAAAAIAAVELFKDHPLTGERYHACTDWWNYRLDFIHRKSDRIWETSRNGQRHI